MHNTRRTTIYDLASWEEVPGLANTIRTRMAKRAVENPLWTTHYDRILGTAGLFGPVHPEDVPFLPTETLYAVDQPLHSIRRTVAQNAAVLRMHATALAGDQPQPSLVDILASVVGAEIWKASLACVSLTRAANKGPDAISSAAAILARVSGHGVEIMPVDPEDPSTDFNHEPARAAAAVGHKWVLALVGPFVWPEVAARVSTDLGWGALGGTRTHQCSLVMGHELTEISSNT